MDSDRCYAAERGEDCYGADENCFPVEDDDLSYEEECRILRRANGRKEFGA